MINREIIRIKIVQLTYAYYQNGNKNIDSAEKELFFSLSKAYDLYNQLLMLIVAVTRESRRRLDVVQAKARREGTPEPSRKFADNRFALQLESNKQLGEFMETQKRTWADEPEFVGHLFELIEQSQIYQDYINDKEDSYAADRELWRKLYKNFILGNVSLDNVLEDQSLYWNGDKEIVDMLKRLSQRIRLYADGQTDFPHEIGAFLGYPLADVESFIENRGKNYAYLGYWKVYHDVEQAVKTFRLFDKERERAVQDVIFGKGIQEIAV